METDWKRVGVACDLAGKSGTVTIAGAVDPQFAVSATDGINVLHVGRFDSASVFGAVQASAFGGAIQLPELNIGHNQKEFLIRSPGVAMELAKIPGGATNLGTGPFQEIGTYGHEFLDAVAAVTHARQSSGERIMGGIHFSFWRKKCWVQCTDSKRLAVALIGAGAPPENTIHPTTIRLLEKVWGPKQVVAARSSPNGMLFAAIDGSWSVYGSGLDGNFPNILSLVDQHDQRPITATFRPADMILHLERAGLVARGEGGADVEVTLSRSQGWVRASSVIGTYEGEFALTTITDQTVSWRWSSAHALAWLTEAKEEVEIKVADSKSPILWRSGEFRGMISPMVD